MFDQIVADAATLVSVVLIDLVLAGDNAVVVGAVAAGLPPVARQRVIVIGVGLALLFRVLFAVVATQLLAIVGLLLAGGLLLLWVAWKMWRELHADEPDPDDPGTERPAKSVSSAIWQVAIADVSMSLDNVLAVAGAARHNVAILVFGLVLSVALMGVAAVYIAKLMHRYPWLTYVGIGVIAVVALSMIWEGAWQVQEAVAGG